MPWVQKMAFGRLAEMVWRVDCPELFGEFYDTTKAELNSTRMLRVSFSEERMRDLYALPGSGPKMSKDRAKELADQCAVASPGGEYNYTGIRDPTFRSICKCLTPILAPDGCNRCWASLLGPLYDDFLRVQEPNGIRPCQNNYAGFLSVKLMRMKSGMVCGQRCYLGPHIYHQMKDFGELQTDEVKILDRRIATTMMTVRGDADETGGVDRTASGRDNGKRKEYTVEFANVAKANRTQIGAQNSVTSSDLDVVLKHISTDVRRKTEDKSDDECEDEYEKWAEPADGENDVESEDAEWRDDENKPRKTQPGPTPDGQTMIDIQVHQAPENCGTRPESSAAGDVLLARNGRIFRDGELSKAQIATILADLALRLRQEALHEDRENGIFGQVRGLLGNPASEQVPGILRDKLALIQRSVSQEKAAVKAHELHEKRMGDATKQIAEHEKMIAELKQQLEISGNKVMQLSDKLRTAEEGQVAAQKLSTTAVNDKMKEHVVTEQSPEQSAPNCNLRHYFLQCETAAKKVIRDLRKKCRAMEKDRLLELVQVYNLVSKSSSEFASVVAEWRVRFDPSPDQIAKSNEIWMRMRSGISQFSILGDELQKLVAEKISDTVPLGWTVAPEGFRSQFRVATEEEIHTDLSPAERYVVDDVFLPEKNLLSLAQKKLATALGLL